MTRTAPLVDSLLQKYWFVQVLMTNPLESVYGNDAGNHGGNHPEMGIPGIPGIYDYSYESYPVIVCVVVDCTWVPRHRALIRCALCSLHRTSYAAARSTRAPHRSLLLLEVAMSPGKDP
jgi:hypothetical protein